MSDWLDWAGIALLLVSALPVLAFAALAMLRWRRGPDPWTVLDGGIALGLLIGVSSWATLFALRMSSGSFVPTGDPPVVPVILATGAGGLCAVLFAWARGGVHGLGLVPHAWRWAGIALVTQIPFLALAAAWTVLLQAVGVQEVEQSLLEVIEGGGPAAAVALVYGLAAAPIIEELLFRGFLLPPVQRAFGDWPAILITGLLFGAMHLSDPAAVFPLVVLGLILGWLRVRSGSLWPCLLLHGVNNLVAVAWLLFGPAI